MDAEQDEQIEGDPAVDGASNEPSILEEDAGGNEELEDNCSICLHQLDDRTVIPQCSHEFCFECLLVWTGQSRRCPLCNQPIGHYIIHSIRSKYDYRKHHLPPLPLPNTQHDSIIVVDARRNAARRRRERERGRRQRVDMSELDRFEQSLSKRRWIYRHGMYAKHVASNSYTKFRPYPTPAQFAASPDLISRTTTFIRRELQVWEALDVEFLTNLIISLMKAIDIRSESAVKLLSEFLDLDAPYVPGGSHVNAEHFAHEVYCYVRSPYKDLFMYDTIVQYDTPAELQPPLEISRRRRWNQQSSSRSWSPSEDKRHRSRQLSRTRRSESGMPSRSYSPSGRVYPTGNSQEPPIPSTSRRTLDDDRTRSSSSQFEERKSEGHRSSLSHGQRELGMDDITVNIDAFVLRSPGLGSDMVDTANTNPKLIDTKGKGKEKDATREMETSESTSFESRGSHEAKNHPDASPPTSYVQEGPDAKITRIPDSHTRQNRDLRLSIQEYILGNKLRRKSDFRPVLIVDGKAPTPTSHSSGSPEPPVMGLANRGNNGGAGPTATLTSSKRIQVQKYGVGEAHTIKFSGPPTKDGFSVSASSVNHSGGFGYRETGFLGNLHASPVQSTNYDSPGPSDMFFDGGACASSPYKAPHTSSSAGSMDEARNGFPSGKVPIGADSHVRSTLSIEKNPIREEAQSKSAVGSINDQDDYFGSDGVRVRLMERLRREKELAMAVYSDVERGNVGIEAIHGDSQGPQSREIDVSSGNGKREVKPSQASQRALLLMRLEAEKKKVGSQVK
ncbi:hypothetical protein FA15DRAFT_671405 [Coprinopsis marcescibilis]|uniref:RING-type E3 ubiquitin transferase n=1 Tax=Coprinopsis marcescibilis TaxID=230819 RepID=A0A5C3KQ96_COPMA|nr:hypothetical protein FA15DRAFT_671405 [Coprinopsis marcescibilis]